MSVKILFYNTHLFGSTLPGSFIGGQGFHDSKRNKAIATYIQSTNADVVCMCEVWDETFKKELVESLKKAYPFSCYNLRASFFTIGSGLIIFSKYKLFNVEFAPLQYLSGMDYFAEKGVFKACIELPSNQHFRVFLTHNQAIPDPSNYREMNAQFIAELARSYFPGFPAIILGDLNMYADNEEYSQLTGAFAEFEDSDANSSTQITYDLENNQLAKRFSNSDDRTGKLDYIFVSKGDWQVNSFEVIKNWTHKDYECSDHFPITAELFLLREESEIPMEYTGKSSIVFPK